MEHYPPSLLPFPSVLPPTLSIEPDDSHPQIDHQRFDCFPPNTHIGSPFEPNGHLANTSFGSWESLSQHDSFGEADPFFEGIALNDPLAYEHLRMGCMDPFYGPGRNDHHPSSHAYGNQRPITPPNRPSHSVLLGTPPPQPQLNNYFLPSPLTSPVHGDLGGHSHLGDGWKSVNPFAEVVKHEITFEPAFSLALSPDEARISQACETCRSRKSKCDGQRSSCSRCLASGTPCVYVARATRVGKSPRAKSVSRGSATATAASASPRGSAVPLSSCFTTKPLVTARSLVVGTEEQRRSSFGGMQSVDFSAQRSSGIRRPSLATSIQRRTSQLSLYSDVSSDGSDPDPSPTRPRSTAQPYLRPPTSAFVRRTSNTSIPLASSLPIDSPLGRVSRLSGPDSEEPANKASEGQAPLSISALSPQSKDTSRWDGQMKFGVGTAA